MGYIELLTFGYVLWLGWLTIYVLTIVRTMRQGKDPRVTRVGKRLMEVEILLSDLQDMYERLMTSHKRLRSSAGMAKLRAVKSEEQETELKHASEAEILRRMSLNRRPGQ